MPSFRPFFAERPPVRWAAESPHYRWLVVGTVCVGAFLGQLDASIAGLVLPTLEDVFHQDLATVEWVSIAYLLVLAALVVPFGRLADLVGRKMLYTTGFVVFILGSGLCGFAPDLDWLVAFRILQAVGAAMLQANSVAIITAAVPRSHLGRAIGVQGAAQAVGLSVGPTLGGLLIATLGWQWVFFIAVPFGLVGSVLGWAVLPQTSPRAVAGAEQEKERFDWIGAALLGPAVGVGLFILTNANAWGWASPRFVFTTFIFCALLAAFLAAESRAASPLVDLHLLHIRPFSLGLLAGLLAYAVLFGGLFLVPFYLERVELRSPAETGLLLTPIPVALGVLAPVAGTITDRFGARFPTTVGMLLSAVALAGLGVIERASTLSLLLLLALLGVGLGMFTPPNNSTIMGSAPLHRIGVAGGVLNMTRSVGTSLGVAATGAVLGLALQRMTGNPQVTTLNASPDALRGAFHGALFFLAGVASIAMVISFQRGNAHDSPAAREAALTESVGV